MIKKIPASELRFGMYIHDLGLSWMDHPFWRARFTLEDPADLQRILDNAIAEVSIDTSKGLDVLAAAPERRADRVAEMAVASAFDDTAPGRAAGIDDCVAATPDQAPAQGAGKTVGFLEEVQVARRLIAQARQQVTQMFNDARMGQVPRAAAVLPLVEEISASVARNPDALISLARMKSRDDYTYMHSVAVCGLMVALARQLGLAPAQVREAGVGGLLHDIGKVAIPLEILNKPASLCAAEYEIVMRHPVAGAELLSQVPGIPGAAVDVVRHHHERFDGRGYPDGLAGGEIDLMARMGTVCDVYDAVTSQRSYNVGWNPAQALSRMAAWKGHFDTAVFQAFVRTVGIYPVGSLVRLESGRLAVVVDQSRASLLSPEVRVFFSTRTMQPLPHQVLRPGGFGCPDRIVAREDPADWGFEHLDDLWLRP